MIPLGIFLLALVYGAFVGFCAGAGRQGLIDKRRYHVRAVALGVLCCALVALGGVLLALGLWALCGPAAWSALLIAGQRALFIYLPFAALILGALGLWLVPIAELRTVVTVLVLGPGTLLRPIVLLVGLGTGMAASPRWEVALVCGYAALLLLPLERWLTRRCFPIDPMLLRD